MVGKEPTISSKTVFKGYVFNIRIDEIEVAGKLDTREIIEHDGGVGILAVDDNGNAYLVRQYRRGADRVMLEIPAGKLMKDEDVLECAIRELKEEVGITAQTMTYLGKFYPTPAYDTEINYIYLAQGLTFGENNPDEGEELDPVIMPLKELAAKARRAEIEDPKTLTSILWAEKYFDF